MIDKNRVGGVQGAISIQGNCIDRADTAVCNGRGWSEEDCMYTLNTIDRPAVLAFRKTAHPRDAEEGQGYEETETADTMNTTDNTETRTPILIYDARGNGDGETVPTITGDHNNRITDYTAICIGNGQLNQMSMQDVSNTLDTMHDQQAVMEREKLIRRLTPLEAERLQAFPDGWTDIGDWTDSNGKLRRTTDSARYKALGNSICLPFWYWLLRRINEHCGEHTMGSLFDGIAGFPRIWEFLNGEGSCRWSSEIEEFCIAVIKRHFGNEETGERGDLYGGDKRGEAEGTAGEAEGSGSLPEVRETGETEPDDLRGMRGIL